MQEVRRNLCMGLELNKNYVSFFPNSYIHWGKLLLFEHKAPESLRGFYLKVSTFGNRRLSMSWGSCWCGFTSEVSHSSHSSPLLFAMACELSLLFISNGFFILKKPIFWHFTMTWNSPICLCVACVYFFAAAPKSANPKIFIENVLSTPALNKGSFLIWKS